jgi:hypothetical protein
VIRPRRPAMRAAFEAKPFVAAGVDAPASQASEQTRRPAAPPATEVKTAAVRFQSSCFPEVPLNGVERFLTEPAILRYGNRLAPPLFATRHRDGFSRPSTVPERIGHPRRPAGMPARQKFEPARQNPALRWRAASGRNGAKKR